MPITTRTATLEDAAVVAALFARVFTEIFGHIYPPADLAAFLAQADAASFAAEIADADHALRLAEDDGVIVGFLKLGPAALPIDLEGRRAVELRQLYLEAHARGGGTGRVLMDWAIGEARARGAQDIYLTVWIGNTRARRFYERYGFVEVGQYAYMVGDTIDDDRILRLVIG